MRSISNSRSQVKQFFAQDSVFNLQLNRLEYPGRTFKENRKRPVTEFSMDLCIKVYNQLIKNGFDPITTCQVGSVNRAYYQVQAKQLKKEGF